MAITLIADSLGCFKTSADSSSDLGESYSRSSSSSGEALLTPALHEIPGSSASAGPSLHPLQLPPHPPPPTTTQNSDVGVLLGESKFDIRWRYQMGEAASYVGPGTSRVCFDKITRKEFICNAREKTDVLLPRRGVEKLKREIRILHYLSGLPNIAMFERAYEDDNNVYMIMEHCRGGSLYERIKGSDRMPEQRAVRVFREIVQAVHSCHLMGVMHRDLNPKNVMMVDTSEESPIRLVGFRHSRFIHEGKTYRSFTGAFDYSAPEMLRGSYGKEADVWSLGVILFFLLSGRRISHRAILQGRFDVQRKPWSRISDSAKELIKKMLKSNPRNRITTSQIIEHPWMDEAGQPAQLPVEFAFLSRFRQIRSMNLIRRLGLVVLVDIEMIAEEDRFHNHKEAIFKSIRDGEGAAISFGDLMNKLFVLGSRLTDTRVMRLISPDNNEYFLGNGDFFEFFAAMLPTDYFKREGLVERIYVHITGLGVRYITKQCLDMSMLKYGIQEKEEHLKKSLREVGKDKHGMMISLSEFEDIMKGPSHHRSLLSRIRDLVPSCSNSSERDGSSFFAICTQFGRQM